ncbi:uncharacterized protein BO80DRAFT_34294 [Aspergillus ibericus CBS 121593]|uniref:Uncharacterized protein n=1 Tax=Aspergillus ibericus CBS 121593 TaxID=1448316 RepID=A0A395H3U6_9EURO|nr:hypothetical protein BO80DRAFT_34294 [Aspergillus ibericus CBS 121593]RAL02416.1 hypothetical protein BO80DRAFT_34294 [Aspergillus ibericus CBS 121593]
MVNWKLPESTDRLIAALIAAHPGLKIDYQTMAIYFGHGATYDTMHGRLRRCHILAEELQKETQERGGLPDLPKGRKFAISTTSTPRTPRGPRNGIQKASSSSSRAKPFFRTSSSLVTPTRSGPTARNPGSAMEVILIDDEFVDVIKTGPQSVLPIADTSSEEDIEIIHHSAPASAPTPAPRINKAESLFHQPPTSFLPYTGFNNVNGYGGEPEQAEIVKVIPSANEPERTETVAPIPIPSNTLSNDPFSTSLGGFFDNPEYDMDDIYGGVA